MSEIKAGIKGEKSDIVTMKNTAIAMGSGELRVYATPALVALVEGCCAESVEEYLEEGVSSTVGSEVHIEHLSPSPVGSGIVCKSVLTEADGRKLSFTAKVYDNAGLIGRGTHTRYIINDERFLQKANDKLQKK